MSASPDSSPGSNSRPFSFGDLGRPRPSARLLPPIKDPDESAELELCADDILESNDADSFDAAAPEIRSVQPAPSEIEVADLGAFEDIEVEGLASGVTDPAPAPAPAAIIVRTEPVMAPVAVPVSMRVEYSSPQPTTLTGFPAAPITSPLPLQEAAAAAEAAATAEPAAAAAAESAAAAEAAAAPAPVVAEHTQEMRADTVAKVAEAASFLDGDIPDETQVMEQTQVLSRNAMPASLQGPRGGHTPPASVHTPGSLAATAPAWANGRHPASGHTPVLPNAQPRLSSIAPVAVDVSRARPPMHSLPVAAAQVHVARPMKSGMSGILVGGLAFGVAALIGVVGVGGYFASRTLSAKPESFATTAAPQQPEPAANTAAAAPADPAAAVAGPVAAAVPAESAPAAIPAAQPSNAGVDVSSLPAAPARGAAVATAPAAPRGPLASRPATGSSQGSSPIATSTGRSGAPLPPPGGGSTPPAPVAQTPPTTGGALALPPPPKPAAPVAAPAAVASTGNVNVDPKLKAVVVDGAFRRVNDGVLTLSCGPHRIKVGMGDQQSVNVPCGGSVSL